MYLVVDRDAAGRWGWSLRADDHRELSASPHRYGQREECLREATDAAGGRPDVPVVEREAPAPSSTRPPQAPALPGRGPVGYWKSYGALLQKQRRA